MTTEPPTKDPIKKHMAQWLGAMTGCQFAARFAKEERGRISSFTIKEISDSTAEELNSAFVGCSQQEKAAVAIFPTLRSEPEIVGLLRLLHGKPRWEAKLLAAPQLSDQLVVSLEWKTDSGAKSRTMGLAPLPTMPVTRRAPYAAIVLWPGKPREEGKSFVGLTDMHQGPEDENYKKDFDRSKMRSQELIADDYKKTAWHKVAFCFSTERRSDLDFL